jgi:hypothetical protein
MSGGRYPSAGDAHPGLAEQAGPAICGAVLRLAYLTGTRIVQAPPWPGAS